MRTPKKSDTLKQGALEPLLLRLRRPGSSNGWDIMQRIRVASGEVLTAPGALYPALHRLEERGLVTSEWTASEHSRRVKLYELTRAGRKQIEAESESWRRFAGAIGATLRDA